jgi:hypothetical protein
LARQDFSCAGRLLDAAEILELVGVTSLLKSDGVADDQVPGSSTLTDRCLVRADFPISPQGKSIVAV